MQDKAVLEAAVALLQEAASNRPRMADMAPSPTFREAAQDWLREGRARWSPSTLRNYEALLAPPERVPRPRGLPPRAWAMRALGGLPVGEVTREHVSRLLADLQDAGLSRRSQQQHSAVIGRVLAHAGVELELAKIPDRRVGKAVLSMEQVAQVMRYADERLVPFIRVSVMTGVRQGELRALQVGDVDLAGGWLHVRRALSAGKVCSPKSGRERMTPIPEGLTGTIVPVVQGSGRRAGNLPACMSEGSSCASAQESSGEFAGTFADALLLPGPSGGVASETWILKTWHKALAAAQQNDATLPDVHWHSLRKTWATTLAGKGIPLPMIQRWGGWQDLGTLQKYLGPTMALSVPEGVSEALRLAA